MLQEEKRRAARLHREKDEPDDEDTASGDDSEGLEQIGRYCDGLARIIIPIIRRLYRGPKAV